MICAPARPFISVFILLFIFVTVLEKGNKYTLRGTGGQDSTCVYVSNNGE